MGGVGAGPEAYQRASAEIASLFAETGEAEAEAREAEVVRFDLDKEADKARQALLVLLNEDLPTITIVVEVNVDVDGPVKLTVLQLDRKRQLVADL